MSHELRSLVRRCVRGEPSATRELMERFRGRVFGLCFRMLGQRQDAEDAVQETFARVFRHLEKWDPQREFEPWLLAIAGNRCRTALAVRTRRPSLGALPEAVPDRGAVQQASAEQLAVEVRLVRGGLRSEHRRAFDLFHQDQLSYQEIAERLGRPVGTVKTWVHRARRQLIEELRQRETVGDRTHAV